MQNKNLIQKAISLLEESGFEAYLVGGIVRDFLMDLPCHDIDLATNALPEQTMKVFSAYTVVPTGLKHGTVTVIFEGEPIEITTYRLEGEYSDGRHPDNVEYSLNLLDDLKRRDFTMNAIAYNFNTGLIDPFDGQKDIKNKLIRCVGTPQKRFSEDSLRILRGLRFSSVLGFDIENETAKAMFELKNEMKNVSNERIFIELSKLVCGQNVKDVLIHYFNCILAFLPEFEQMQNFKQHNPHHIYDVLTHTAVVVENSPQGVHLRLAALFHDCGKPECFSLDENGVGHFYAHAKKSAEITQNVLTRLKCDNATKNKVVKLIKIHDTPIEANERLIKKRMARLGTEMFFDLIALQRADNLGQAPQYRSRQEKLDEIIEIANKIIAESQCFSLKDLNINGNDLISLGFSGKKIGELLNLILNEVIDGKLENEKDELINFAKNHLI